MAEEIENYLLDKLTKDIEEMGASDHKLVAKIVPLKPQFLKLKAFLDNTTRFPLGSTRKKEKIYYLNNELSQWQLIAKKHSPFAFVSEVLAYNDLSRRLKKIKIEFKDGDQSQIVADSVNVGTSLPNSSETYRRKSSREPPSKVHGFDLKIKSLERMIFPGNSNDEKFKAIGVVGMVGVGKTTLCQIIFNQPKVKEHFLPRIWVCLSKQPNEDIDNRKEIVKRILRCLGVEEEIMNNSDLSGLISALHLQLIGKRYLIVLDDASKNENFYENLGCGSNLNENWGEKLGYGLPKGWGGTVIVTSRSEEIAKKMVGEKNLNFVEPLSDADSCWKIFKDAVEKDEKEFPEDLKERILIKCSGLPLAARMLGQIAHEQQLEERAEVNENKKNGVHQHSQQPSS